MRGTNRVRVHSDKFTITPIEAAQLFLNVRIADRPQLTPCPALRSHRQCSGECTATAYAQPPDPKRRSPAAVGTAVRAGRVEVALVALVGASRSSYHKFYGEPIVIDVIKAAVAPQQSAGRRSCPPPPLIAHGVADAASTTTTPTAAATKVGPGSRRPQPSVEQRQRPNLPSVEK